MGGQSLPPFLDEFKEQPCREHIYLLSIKVINYLNILPGGNASSLLATSMQTELCSLSQYQDYYL